MVSCCCSHFSESLGGLLSLRCFRQQPSFTRRNRDLLDASNRIYWAMQNVRPLPVSAANPCWLCERPFLFY